MGVKEIVTTCCICGHRSMFAWMFHHASNEKAFCFPCYRQTHLIDPGALK